MTTVTFYIIEPHPAHLHSVTFIETLCGKCELLLFSEIDSNLHDVLHGSLLSENHETLIRLIGRGPYAEFADILPAYVNGKAKGMVSGYIILLMEDILDFSDGPSSYYARVKQDFQMFQQLVVDTPYVIVLGSETDTEGKDIGSLVMTMRKSFQLENDVKILSCNVKSIENIKQIILYLTTIINSFSDIRKVTDLIKSIK